MFDKPRVTQHLRGFTLIEVIVVIILIGALTSFAVVRLGISSSWNEEGAIRRLAETLSFLHFQSAADQAFYRLEFNLDDDSYRIGVVRPESDVNQNLAQQAGEDLGNLTLELADFLNPAASDAETIIPPPNFPSLAEPQYLPATMYIEDIRNMSVVRTKEDGGRISLLFSPRGFSEFGVIHLRISENLPITLVTNPYTGEPEIYRDYREFRWQGGR